MLERQTLYDRYHRQPSICWMFLRRPNILVLSALATMLAGMGGVVRADQPVPQFPSNWEASERPAVESAYAEPQPGSPCCPPCGCGPCVPPPAGPIPCDECGCFDCTACPPRWGCLPWLRPCRCASWCDACPDAEPRYGLCAFHGFDSWQGTGNLKNSNGLSVGTNVGLPVPWLDKFGIGVQGGLSYGAYQFGRTVEDAGQNNLAQQQIYFTTGFFRRATADCRLSGGIVYDWQINDNVGGFNADPNLGQGRAQIAYAFTPRNEYGLWASWRLRDGSAVINTEDLAFRPLTQLNFFYHHHFVRGTDFWIWVGHPDFSLGAGRASQMLFGFRLEVPATNYLQLYTNFQILPGISRSNLTEPVPTHLDAYNVSVGITLFPGTARSRTVAGRRWMPLLPVANNGTFMTQTRY